MSTAHPNAGLNYTVTVARQDERRAVATTRGHELTLNVKKGDGSAGFNAAETLLAALGACTLTNVNTIAAKMRLQIDHAEMRFSATRQDEPPILTEIQYELILESPEPADKLEELYRLAVKWGTVTSTLAQGILPAGRLTVRTSPAGGGPAMTGAGS